MKEKTAQPSLLKSSATAGMILGATIVGVSVLSYIFKLTNNSYGIISSILEFGAIILIIWYNTKKYSLSFGDRGFTFSQSMGFILTTMLFAGFIAGFGQYIMQTKVDPQYYKEILEKAIEASKLKEFSTPESLEQAQVLAQNAIYLTFSWMITMLMYGGLVGLIISAFLKRNPTPTKSNDDEM